MWRSQKSVQCTKAGTEGQWMSMVSVHTAPLQLRKHTPLALTVLNVGWHKAYAFLRPANSVKVHYKSWRSL
jgi:hypothetical protein